MSASRGRSRSVSKPRTDLLTMAINAVIESEGYDFTKEKDPFPLFRLIAESEQFKKIQQRWKEEENNKIIFSDDETSDIREDVFRIDRTNKSLESIKGKRKRTYYWKLFELASLFMVSLCLSLSFT